MHSSCRGRAGSGPGLPSAASADHLCPDQLPQPQAPSEGPSAPLSLPWLAHSGAQCWVRRTQKHLLSAPCSPMG